MTSNPAPANEGKDVVDPAAAALVPAIEAVLFASPEPLSLHVLAKVFGMETALKGAGATDPHASPKKRLKNGVDSAAGDDTDPSGFSGLATLKQALAILAGRAAADGRGIRLVEVANGWQFVTREDYFPYVQKIAKTRAEEKLSPAVIETLSVVAYKQPVTRAEVDAIRGAQSGPHIRNLMDKGLVKVLGRAESPGAPFTYGTTRQFLRHFGLKSPKDLPDPKELGRILREQERAARS